MTHDHPWKQNSNPFSLSKASQSQVRYYFSYMTYMQNCPMVALIQWDWKWNSSTWTPIASQTNSGLSQDARSWWPLLSDADYYLLIQTEKFQADKDKGTEE